MEKVIRMKVAIEKNARRRKNKSKNGKGKDDDGV